MMETRDNPDGSKVRVKFIASHGRWPRADIKACVEVGQDLTVMGDVIVAGTNARIGNNVTLNHCVMQNAQIEDDVVVLGTEQNPTHLTECHVEHHALVHGRFGGGVRIGASSQVWGSIPAGYVGKESKVLINKDWDVYCASTINKVLIGDHNYVDIRQHELVGVEGILLHKLVVRDGCRLHLGMMTGELVSIGSDVTLGTLMGYCQVSDIDIPDNAFIESRRELDANSFILVQGSCTWVVYSNGETQFYRWHRQINIQDLLSELAGMAVERLKDRDRRIEQAEGRYNAACDEAAAFSERMKHLAQKPQKAQSQA